MRYLIMILFLSQSLFAQQFLTKTGEVSFFSFATLEDIQAENNNLGGVLDINSGEYAFKIAIQDFIFPNSLMQEHFNESYLESDKFPYATFQGKIENLSATDLQSKSEIVCKGKFTIHGVTKNVELKSVLQKKEDSIEIESVFFILLKDYDIKIPKIVFYNIAEEIRVNVSASLKQLK